MSKIKDSAALAVALIESAYAAGKEVNPPHRVADQVAELFRIGAGVSRRAVQACNGPWNDDIAKRAERADRRAESRANEILAEYGAVAFIGGDPRGYVFRAVLSTKASNCFGGHWGIV